MREKAGGHGRRLDGADDLLPDASCLLQTMHKNAHFPVDAIEAAAYRAACVGQKTCYGGNGVAILSPMPATDVRINIPDIRRAWPRTARLESDPRPSD